MERPGTGGGTLSLGTSGLGGLLPLLGGCGIQGRTPDPGMDTLGTFYNEGTPQWVFDAGAKYVDEPIDLYRGTFLLNDIPENGTFPVRYPVYWDEIYLEKTEQLVRALGKRYNGRPEVEYVVIGHMGRWGEMHIADPFRIRRAHRTCMVFPTPPGFSTVRRNSALS